VFAVRVQDDKGGVSERKYKLNTPIVRRVLAPGDNRCDGCAESGERKTRSGDGRKNLEPQTLGAEKKQVLRFAQDDKLFGSRVELGDALDHQQIWLGQLREHRQG